MPNEDSYIIDGKEYIRVTRVLDVIAKPELYRWIGKYGWDYCEGVKDKRASFGTRVHKEIQNYLTGAEVWVDSVEMQKTLSLFTSWVNSHRVIPDSLEFRVKSDSFMFGGTCDFIGGFDDKRTLIDWKTSKYVFDHYKLQVVAYAMALEEMGLEPVEQCKIVSIRDGGITSGLIKRDEFEDLYKVFLCARRIYKWKYGK